MQVALQERTGLYETLERVAKAQPRHLDRWAINISCGEPVFGELPHSLGKTSPDTSGHAKVVPLPGILSSASTSVSPGVVAVVQETQ